MQIYFSDDPPKLPDLAKHQSDTIKAFITASSDLIQLGLPLCNSCALFYVQFAESLSSKQSKKKTRLQKRKEYLRKETQELRELLHRLNSRIRESHTDDTSVKTPELDKLDSNSNLVPPLDDVESCLDYPYHHPDVSAAYKVLIEEEDRLQREIELIFEEREELLLESNKLAAQSRAVDESEILLQRSSQDLQALVTDLAKAQNSLRVRAKDAYTSLHQLATASPLTDLFPIELHNDIPTISGFQLGRTAVNPVDWTEISLALGQVALLLDTLRRRNNFKISHLSLIPRGANSFILRIKDDPRKNDILHLHRGEKIGLNLKIISKTTPFDLGLEALLEILHLFYLSFVDKDPKLKDDWSTVDLEKYTIGGYHVRYSSDKEVQWTCAMRCLLYNCKKLLLFSIQKND